MTTPENTPRKSKTARLGLILGVVVIVAAVAALSIYLIGKQQERVAIEVMHILETAAYVSPTPTVTGTPSATPLPTNTPPPTRTMVPTNTRIPPTPIIGPTLTPRANYQPALPLSVGYTGEPYAMTTDGASMWITYADRKLIEKRDVRTGEMQHQLHLSYKPSSLIYGGGSVWVYDRLKSLIHEINAETGYELNSMRKTIGVEASLRFAWDGVREKLWAFSEGDATRFDPVTGDEEDTIELGFTIYNVAFGEDAYFFLMGWRNSIVTVDAETDEISWSAKLCDGVTNMVQVGDRLWLTCEEDHAVIAFDMAAQEVAHRGSTPTTPYGIFTNGTSLWVMNNNADLIPVNPETGTLSRQIYLSFYPNLVLWVGDTLWMENSYYEGFNIYDFGGDPSSLSTPVAPPIRDGEGEGSG